MATILTGNGEAAPKPWPGLFSKALPYFSRRTLRLGSGLILFAYITMHLANHALGLISLDAAEAGLKVALVVWHSWPGTGLLYGAFVFHFFNALWAVYEMRTFRVPPAELLRIVLGFWLPIALIGHIAATRIAFAVFDQSSTYSLVVGNLLASGFQGWQMGLLAPGWIHGCLGIHFAFSRRLFYIRYRYILFAAALLLPVLSAVGFLTMGRELAALAIRDQVPVDYYNTATALQRAAILHWRDGLMATYLIAVAVAFCARATRNAVGRSKQLLISISYPSRSVQVPRGWTVLEASRSFRIPHVSMCGGKARCSTCRVRIIEGADVCPSPDLNETATLRHIRANSDIRLACQLRPNGDITVVPLVDGERIPADSRSPRHSDNQDVVVMLCNFSRRVAPSQKQMQQDALYMQSTYLTEACKAIEMASGMVVSVQPDGISALFGVHHGLGQAARLSLQAAGDIDRVMKDINERLVRSWPAGIDFAVTVHAGHVMIREIDSDVRPVVIAIGDAIEVTNDLHKAAAKSMEGGKPFTISETVYAAASVSPSSADKMLCDVPTSPVPLVVFRSASAPILAAHARVNRRRERISALRRFWSG